VDSHCLKGYEYLMAERYAEAFEEFAAVSRLDPREARSYMGMGEAAKHLDYDELAEENYRKAIKLEPRLHEAKMALAQILCDFGKHTEALGVLRELEKERPEDPLVWAELAINTLRLGRPEEAVPLLEKYNAARGKQDWGYENLGRAYAEAGEMEKAERAYREAIAINPQTALAHLWLGQLLRTTGRKDEAERALETFRRLRALQTEMRLLEQKINRNPGNVRAHVELARVRRLLGKGREALIPLERALEIAPDDAKLRKLYENVRRKVEEETRGR
jgi:Flp pilus assembly protein TadD